MSQAGDLVSWPNTGTHKHSDKDPGSPPQYWFVLMRPVPSAGFEACVVLGPYVRLDGHQLHREAGPRTCLLSVRDGGAPAATERL